MSRKLIAAVTAFAIALTGMTTTPASALSEAETRRLLLGALALGLIINELDKPDRRPVQGAPVYTRDRRAIIPAACIAQVRNRGRVTDVVTQRCVEQSGLRVRLPRDCGLWINRHGHRSVVYATSCLSENGFRIGRNGGYRDWRHDDGDGGRRHYDD